MELMNRWPKKPRFFKICFWASCRWKSLLCEAHEWEHILFLLTSPIFFFFFHLLFCRKDCAKTIDRIKTKFSHNVPLMRLQRTSPFRNAHFTQRPLVAVLIFSTTNFLASIQQRPLIAAAPNFNTLVLARSHSERPLFVTLTSPSAPWWPFWFFQRPIFSLRYSKHR